MADNNSDPRDATIAVLHRRAVRLEDDAVHWVTQARNAITAQVHACAQAATYRDALAAHGLLDTVAVTDEHRAAALAEIMAGHDLELLAGLHRAVTEAARHADRARRAGQPVDVLLANLLKTLKRHLDTYTRRRDALRAAQPATEQSDAVARSAAAPTDPAA